MEIFRKLIAFFTPKPEIAGSSSLGRNEPCWCGSGRKYKKCHLLQDEAKARKNYAGNCVKS